MSPSSSLARWLGVSVTDTMGRLLLQIISTAIFARLLLPEDFGLAALGAALIAVAAAVITSPLEEVLAQRKRLQSAHVRSALGLTLLLSSLACATIWLLGRWQAFGQSHVYPLLLGFSIVLFAEGPIAVYSAMARRQRNFSLLAWTNLSGLAFGTVVGIALAYLGAGVWSLLAVRIVSRFITLAGLIHRLSHLSMRPRLELSIKHLRDLSGFAGWLMAGRIVETLTEATFQLLVNYFFGLAANGYLNMAMRIVEPLRGAVGSISHNLASAYYFKLQLAPERLGQSIAATIADSSWLLQPVFLGLAAIAPTLILLLGGREWEAAIPLAVCLAIVACISTVANFLHSGLSACARNDLGLIASCLEFVTLIISLMLWSEYGLIAIGTARLVAVMVDAGYVLVSGRMIFALRPTAILRSLLPATACALVMACAVVALGLGARTILNTGSLLALQILLGMAVHALLMICFYRQRLMFLLGKLFQAPSTGSEVR